MKGFHKRALSYGHGHGQAQLRNSRAKPQIKAPGGLEEKDAEGKAKKNNQFYTFNHNNVMNIYLNNRKSLQAFGKTWRNK